MAMARSQGPLEKLIIWECQFGQLSVETHHGRVPEEQRIETAGRSPPLVSGLGKYALSFQTEKID